MTTPRKKTEKSKDRMIVLLENIEGQVKTVAEGHSVLVKKIDDLDLKVDGLGVRMDRVEGRLDMVEIKVDRLENKMDEGFKLVLDHLDGIDREFMELKNDLKNNYERKGHDLAWRKAMEKRVEKLEKILMSKRLVKA